MFHALHTFLTISFSLILFLCLFVSSNKKDFSGLVCIQNIIGVKIMKIFKTVPPKYYYFNVKMFAGKPWPYRNQCLYFLPGNLLMLFTLMLY